MKSDFVQHSHLAPGVASVEFGRADLGRAYMAALSSDGKIITQVLIPTVPRMPKVRERRTDDYDTPFLVGGKIGIEHGRKGHDL